MHFASPKDWSLNEPMDVVDGCDITHISKDYTVGDVTEELCFNI